MNLRISLRSWLLETLLLVLSLILCAMVARADGGPAQPAADPSGLDWDASVKECTVGAAMPSRAVSVMPVVAGLQTAQKTP